MNQAPEEGTFPKITAFPKRFTNGLCYGPTFGHINYVVPAIWSFWSCCSNGVLLCCWMVTLMVSHQPAAAGSSSEDHGCSWGHRQGEHLAHSLSDGNLMSFSSTSVWDVKDALIIKAGRKISSGTLPCWKTLILQYWNTSQEHVDSIEGFDGKQTGRLSGKPELLVLCQPGLPWLPAPQVASSPSFWHPYQVSTLEVGQPGVGSKTWNGRGHWPSDTLFCSSFLWRFSFLYKNMNYSGKNYNHFFDLPARWYYWSLLCLCLRIPYLQLWS